MEIVEAGALGTRHQLRVMRAAIAGLVPLYACLGIVTIRGNLHHRAWTMFIKPAQEFDELPLPAITPEAEAIRLGRMDPKFGAFATFHRPRPGIAHNTVGQKAEVIGLRRVHRHRHTFGTKAILDEGDMVFTWCEIRLHCPARGRTHNGDRLAPLLKLQEHIGDGNIAFITDISD